MWQGGADTVPGLSKIGDLTVVHNRRFHAAFPAAVRLGDGRVLVVFRRARDPRWLWADQAGADPALDRIDHLDPRSQLAAVWLAPDTLAPLGPPVGLAPDPEAGDQDASLLALTDGRLLLGGFAWYPLAPQAAADLRAVGAPVVGGGDAAAGAYLFWGGYTRLSDDRGVSWTDHRYLPRLPPVGTAPIVTNWWTPARGGAVRGRPVEAPDGRLLLATYGRVPGYRAYVSFLFVSHDRGCGWACRGPIAADPEGRHGYAEPALWLCPTSGRLIAFHRSFGADDRLITVTSDDLGATWGAPTVHEVTGHPFDVLALGDGRAVLVYGYRHPPYGVRARLWRPADGSPADAPELVVRDDAPSGDLGYPWAVALGDGRLLVVYYQCDGDGIRHIAGSLLSVSAGATQGPRADP